MKVVAYILPPNSLSKRVVPFMVAGAKAVGDSVTVMQDTEYTPLHADIYDVAVFWGYVETLQNAMKGFTEAGKKVVYLDLAYWERGTHYKVSLNARHPTAYFRDRPHDDTRRKRFGVEISPYMRKGQHILVAGLSQKAAWAEKEGPWGEYEAKAVEELQRYTQRPIIYRAKTSGTAAPIPGTRYSNLAEPLMPLLRDAWAVVTRHSNVAVDGLVIGVPAFAWYGVASVMAARDLAMIEKPYYPEGREQWLNDISYCQWSEDEMKDGTCWRHLKHEGLLP
jgi:hypothetical protein